MPINEERSPLWGMAAGGAAVGGFAYGMRGNWQDLYSAVRGPGLTGARKIATAATGMQRYTTARPAVNTMAALGDLAIDPRMTPRFGEELASLTYESIMGGPVPVGHSKAQSAMRNVLQQAGAEGVGATEIYRTALSQITEQGGDISRFQRAVQGVVGDPSGLTGSARFGNPVLAANKPGVNERIGFETLSAAERKEYESVMSRLGGEDMLKGELKARNIRFHRVGPEGVAMARIPVKGAGNIDLPLSLAQTNVMYGGENFSNRYIARGAWEITGAPSSRALQTKSFNDHYIDAIAKALTKDGKGRRPVKEAIHDANRMVIQGVMDSADAAAAKAAIWSPGEELLSSGGYLKEQMARSQLIYGGSSLTPDLLEEAISISGKTGQPLTPFVGAGAAGKGTLAMGDLRQAFYGNLGELFPAQKQPFQMVRSEWGLTENAMAMAEQAGQRFGGTFGQHNQRLLQKGMGAGYIPMTSAGGKAYVAPQMLTLYSVGQKDVPGVIAEEMGIMSRRAAELQEYQRIKGVTVRATQDMPGHSAIVNALSSNQAIGEQVMFDQPVPLTKGELIGVSAKTNVREFGRAAPGLSQEIIGVERVDQERVKAIIRETHEATGRLPRKYFGAEVKHMIQDVPDEEFGRLIRGQAGFTQQGMLGGLQVEQFMTGERVRKNPYALARQQISAMDVLVSGKIDRARGRERRELEKLANPFFKNQTEFLDDIFTNPNIKTQEELQYQVQRRIVEQAKTLGVAQGEAGGLIFGATSDAHMERLRREGVIRGAHVKAWTTAENVIGMSTPFLGDLAYEGGSGKRGTMDVAGFRLLAEKSYQGAEDLGALAAVDIAERTVSPRAAGDIAKMHGSIIGEVDPMKARLGLADDAVDLASFNESLISREGRWYDLGQKIDELGGARRVYIPGIDKATQLAPTVGTTGEPIASGIHKQLGGLRSALAAGNQEAISAAAAGLAQASHVEFARATTERGKVIGSRVLTGQQMTAAQQAAIGEDVIGVSRGTGRRMFEEMIEQAPAGRQDFLRQQMAAFEAGEAVSGVGWRHPMVGPESAQVVKFAAMEGAEEAMVYMPRKMGQISVGGEMVTKDLSPLVGWKGDFDKDQFVLSAIGRQDVEKRAANLANNEIAASYNQYLGRHYAMERMVDKNLVASTSGVARGIDALRQEARSHAYAKMATGPTNVALQQLKVAVAGANPQHYDELAAAMWHMEETAAIGSKHGLDIGGGDLYKRLGSAVRNRSEAEMEGVLRSVFGEKQTISSMVQGVETAVDYDPKLWSQRMIGSLRQSPDEIMEAVKLGQMATKGESRATAKAMVDQYLMISQGASPDIGQVMAGAEAADTGVFSGLQRGGRAVRNRLRAVGGVLSRAKKPMLLGGAAAGAIAMAAPSISGSLTVNPNKEGAAGGRNTNIAESIPTGGLEMTPPSNAIMRSPRVYDVGGMSTRVEGKYVASDLDMDRTAIMRQVAAMRANGANTRMNIRDNRAALDSHMLANKIHERL